MARQTNKVVGISFKPFEETSIVLNVLVLVVYAIGFALVCVFLSFCLGFSILSLAGAVWFGITFALMGSGATYFLGNFKKAVRYRKKLRKA